MMMIPHAPELTRLRYAGGRVIIRAAVIWIGLHAAAPLAAAQRAERFTAWTHPTFPLAEYLSRRDAVMRALGDRILLVPGAEGTSTGETFRQLDDFEYLAGLEVPRSVLAIDGTSRRSFLFVPRMDARFDNPDRPNDFPGRPLAADPALRAMSGVDSVIADSDLDRFHQDERISRKGSVTRHRTILSTDEGPSGQAPLRDASRRSQLTFGPRPA